LLSGNFLFCSDVQALNEEALDDINEEDSALLNRVLVEFEGTGSDFRSRESQVKRCSALQK